jgi:hypothetical protein
MLADRPEHLMLMPHGDTPSDCYWTTGLQNLLVADEMTEKIFGPAASDSAACAVRGRSSDICLLFFSANIICWLRADEWQLAQTGHTRQVV